MSDLPAQTQAFLARAKQAHRSTVEDRARVRVLLQASLATVPLAARVSAPPNAAPLARVARVFVNKLLLGTLIGLASVSAVVLLLRADHDRVVASKGALAAPPSAQAAPARAPEVAVPMSVELGRSDSADPLIARDQPALPSAPAQKLRPAFTSSAAATVGSTLPGHQFSDEVRLIRDANAALARGEPKAAWELLDEHARTFPRGGLREEREATRVLTLCDLGRVEQARVTAEALLRAAGNSPYAERLRASCAYAESPSPLLMPTPTAGRTLERTDRGLPEP